MTITTTAQWARTITTSAQWVQGASNLVLTSSANMENAVIWQQSPTWSDDGSTPASINDPIYRFDDASGNDTHFSETTETNRPILTADGIYFNGSDNRMSAALSSFIANKASFTIYIVFRPISTGGHATYLSFGYNASNNPYLWFEKDSADQLRLYGVSDSANVDSDTWSGLTTGVDQIHTWVGNGTTIIGRVNGVQQLSFTYPAGGWGFDQYALGTLWRSSYSNYGEMYLKSHHLFSEAHNSSEAGANEGDLGDFWGIAV